MCAFSLLTEGPFAEEFSPGEESKFSTVLVILPDFLFHDTYIPVVDNAVSSVILNSPIS